MDTATPCENLEDTHVGTERKVGSDDVKKTTKPPKEETGAMKTCPDDDRGTGTKFALKEGL